MDCGDASEDFKPLTQEQAQALRDAMPPVSPWRVIAAQAAVGCVVCVLTWMLTGQREPAWSALYGVCAVVVPQALFARGIARLSGAKAGAAVTGFFIWELVKIIVAVLMLGVAAIIVPGLSWPALLVAMIVCMKTSWLAPLLRRRPVQRT